jgi:hypothetical protein
MDEYEEFRSCMMEIIEGLWRLDAGYEYPKITRSPCFCGVLDMNTERCWQAHSFVFPLFFALWGVLFSSCVTVYGDLCNDNCTLT